MGFEEEITGSENFNPFSLVALWRRFRQDPLAVVGMIGIIFILFLALFAPLLANGRPWLLYREGHLSSPAFSFLFSPDSNETTVEKIFNYFLLLIPLFVFVQLVFWKLAAKWRWMAILILALALTVPFILGGKRLDKTDWRKVSQNLGEGEFAVFAPVPYGPFENVAKPYQKSSVRHWFGTDEIGRDVFSRMLYGARVSLAVGILATMLSLGIGVTLGLMAGYFGGTFDILAMRIVEIVICFPTFLLLLILMSILIENKFTQSILLVILVIGLTGWTGFTRLVRGESLKQRALPYIHSCEVIGLPKWRILFIHLLPNVSGPVMVAFTFGVAAAILTESGLSFLGFGVQPPTASWGELIRQAFADPFTYWHLIFWPGLALFITLSAFNFTAEGLRKMLDPKA